LKENNVEFEYVDIDQCNPKEKNNARQDIQNRGGRLLYPTIIIDNKILFNGAPQDKLREVLEI
jgi:disulfide oxidoreductase YuzD